MKTRILALVACLSLAPSAVCVNGATVDVLKTDPSTHTVTIRLLNNSTKDITAYAVSLETVYADGSSSFSEHDEDLGPRAVAQHTTIAPGESHTFTASYNQEKPFAHVAAKVVSVIYTDQTGEGDQEPFDRVVSVRKGIANSLRKEAALAQSARHEPNPAGLIDKAVTEIVRHQQANHLHDTDTLYLKKFSEEIKAQSDPKAYLEKRVPELQREAKIATDYANVRREQ